MLECQGSNEVFSELCSLFSNNLLDHLHTFHWIARVKDKSSELGEKVWLRLCEAMHAVPSLNIHSLRTATLAKRAAKSLKNSASTASCRKSRTWISPEIGSGTRGFAVFFAPFSSWTSCLESVFSIYRRIGSERKASKTLMLI